MKYADRKLGKKLQKPPFGQKNVQMDLVLRVFDGCGDAL